jgi:hypothetical protein
VHIELDSVNRDQAEDRQAVPRQPLSIPVPGLDRTMGLGDAAKRLTAAFGVKPCGGCKKRAEAMNERVRLVPWG